MSGEKKERQLNERKEDNEILWECSKARKKYEEDENEELEQEEILVYRQEITEACIVKQRGTFYESKEEKK